MKTITVILCTWVFLVVGSLISPNCFSETVINPFSGQSGPGYLKSVSIEPETLLDTVSINPSPIQCGESVFGSNNPINHLNNFNSYPCDQTSNHSPADNCYSITVTGPVTLHINLTNYGPNGDLDLILLDNIIAPQVCLGYSCGLGLGPEVIHYTVNQSGTYTFYIIVDGKVSTGITGLGEYNLVVTCEQLPVNTCVSPCPNPEEVIMSGVPGVGIPDPDWTISTGGFVTQAVGIDPSTGIGWQAPFAGTNWISAVNPDLTFQYIYL